jgi:hypothetical protein
VDRDTHNGRNQEQSAPSPANGPSPANAPIRPTLNTAVRQRRTDRAFYIRLAGAIRQNQRALHRLKR